MDTLEILRSFTFSIFDELPPVITSEIHSKNSISLFIPLPFHPLITNQPQLIPHLYFALHNIFFLHETLLSAS